MSDSLPAAPKNILIIRLSAIGDVILASGLIPLLRNSYPDARISWLTEEGLHPLLSHNPRLDQVLVWPRRRWQQLRRDGHYGRWLQESRGMIRELRDARYDLVLDLQGLLKSGLWAWLSGGAPRIGLGSKEGSRWLMHKVVSRGAGTKRIGAEYRKFAEAIGLTVDAYALDIVPGLSATETAARLLAEQGLADGNYAVIAPFTTRPQKHWFDERWAAFATDLRQQRGLNVVMLGGKADQQRARSIVAMAPTIIDLTGQTGLDECAAIIERAALLVGVDTGLTHLGIAMRTPTLALFGSTRPYLHTDVATARVLYEQLECSPCRRRPTCDGRFDCMRSHTADHVVRQAIELLAVPKL